MEANREELDGIYLFFYRHWPSLLIIAYPILILLDHYSVPSAARIYAGQPFFYSWYIDANIHFGLLLLLGALLFIFLIIRLFIVKSGPFRFVPPILFLIFFFSALLMSEAIGTTHIATTPVLNQTKYNLYRQIYSGHMQNHYVLVSCDSLGLLCRFVEKWEHKVTLFSNSSASLSSDNVNNALYVIIDGEVVYTRPIP